MTDLTQQAQLVEQALKLSDPQNMLANVVARLAAAGTSPALLALVPVAGREILMRAGLNGEAVLELLLYASWQELLGLPDAVAQAVAVTDAQREAIAEAVLAEAAATCAAEGARISALPTAQNTVLPEDWNSNE